MATPLKSYILDMINELNIYSKDSYDLSYRGKNHQPVLILNNMLIIARGWKQIKGVVEWHYSMTLEKMYY